MIQEQYPQLADHTQIGGQTDQRNISGLLNAVEAIPDELIPRDLQTRLVVVLGRFKSAVETWNAGGRGQHYMSGRDIRDLLTVLQACPDEAVSDEDVDLAFVDDQEFRRSLSADAAAAHRSLGHGEWRAATVLAGSVVEALLLVAIRSRADDAQIRAVTDGLMRAQTLNRPLNPDILRWDLSELLAVAHALGIVNIDTSAIGQSAREYRNLIHPGRELRTRQRCTKGTAHVAIGMMERTIEDLRRA